MTISHCLRAAILANSHMTYQPHLQVMGEELGRPQMWGTAARRGRLDTTLVTRSSKYVIKLVE